jgi:hypothetical protein
MQDLACVGLRRHEHPQKHVITIEPRHSGRSAVLLVTNQWVSLGEVARPIVDRLREAVRQRSIIRCRNFDTCPGGRP